MSPSAFRIALFCLALPIYGVDGAVAADSNKRESDGRAILETNCARCHSVVASGKSPLSMAPPLRDIYRTYPIERLEFELSEGIGSRHKDMPQIQFSADEITGILKYLHGLAGAK